MCSKKPFLICPVQTCHHKPAISFFFKEKDGLCFNDTTKRSSLNPLLCLFYELVSRTARYQNASLWKECKIHDLYEWDIGGGLLLQKKCRLCRPATASPVRQELYRLRGRLKLIENESEFFESLHLQLCSDFLISLSAHARALPGLNFWATRCTLAGNCTPISNEQSSKDSSLSFYRVEVVFKSWSLWLNQHNILRHTLVITFCWYVAVRGGGGVAFI